MRALWRWLRAGWWLLAGRPLSGRGGGLLVLAVVVALAGCAQPLTCSEARTLQRWHAVFGDPAEVQRLASFTASRACGTWRPWE